MTACDQARERARQVVGRRLADERTAARSGLDDSEKLQAAEGLAYGRPGDLELLRQLTLRRQLVARAEIAFLEETLDLLDDPLVKPASPDGLDDGQVLPPQALYVAKRTVFYALVRWSDHAAARVVR